MIMFIATLSLPPDAVALEHTLGAVPGVEVEAERIAAHSTTWTMPCLWAAGAEFEAVDQALEDDPTVEEIIDRYEFDDEKYYQLDLAGTVKERINSYLDQEASLLEASANSEGWRLKFRFATRERFDTFREELSERGHSFQLQRLSEPGEPRQTVGGVTPDQREALVTARERGYFQVPREITARKLAEELDVSHQSVSEILRRGTENLITATFTVEGEGP